MIRNDYYYDSIALLFKNNTIIGWVPTHNEADEICKHYTDIEWDEYNEHKDYVDLKKIDRMSYLLTTEALSEVLHKDTDQRPDTKADQSN